MISELIQNYPVLKSCEKEILSLVKLMTDTFRNGGTFFCCGNGGSAADCSHICTELLKGFVSKRPLNDKLKSEFTAAFGSEGREIADQLQSGLRAVDLAGSSAFITAVSNDIDADLVFAQNLLALAKKDDILLAISTSGNSANIKKALMAAKIAGVKSFLLTGSGHGICEKYADTVIAVPAEETYRIQELHLPVYHAVCREVEHNIFS